MQIDQLETGQPGFVGRGRIMVIQVRLAHQGGAIAGALQPGRQQHFARRQGRVVHAVAMAVRIAAREERSPRGNADRRLHEGVGEVGRLPGRGGRDWAC